MKRPIKNHAFLFMSSMLFCLTTIPSVAESQESEEPAARAATPPGVVQLLNRLRHHNEVFASHAAATANSNSTALRHLDQEIEKYEAALFKAVDEHPEQTLAALTKAYAEAQANVAETRDRLRRGEDAKGWGLRGSVSIAFHAQTSLQSAKLRIAESRLTELKIQYSKRLKNSDAVIDRRVASLLKGNESGDTSKPATEMANTDSALNARNPKENPETHEVVRITDHAMLLEAMSSAFERRDHEAFVALLTDDAVEQYAAFLVHASRLADYGQIATESIAGDYQMVVRKTHAVIKKHLAEDQSQRSLAWWNQELMPFAFELAGATVNRKRSGKPLALGTLQLFVGILKDHRQLAIEMATLLDELPIPKDRSWQKMATDRVTNRRDDKTVQSVGSPNELFSSVRFSRMDDGTWKVSRLFEKAIPADVMYDMVEFDLADDYFKHALRGDLKFVYQRGGFTSSRYKLWSEASIKHRTSVRGWAERFVELSAEHLLTHIPEDQPQKLAEAMPFFNALNSITRVAREYDEFRGESLHAIGQRVMRIAAKSVHARTRFESSKHAEEQRATAISLPVLEFLVHTTGFLPDMQTIKPINEQHQQQLKLLRKILAAPRIDWFQQEEPQLAGLLEAAPIPVFIELLNMAWSKSEAERNRQIRWALACVCKHTRISSHNYSDRAEKYTQTIDHVVMLAILESLSGIKPTTDERISQLFHSSANDSSYSGVLGKMLKSTSAERTTIRRLLTSMYRKSKSHDLQDRIKGVFPGVSVEAKRLTDMTVEPMLDGKPIGTSSVVLPRDANSIERCLVSTNKIGISAVFRNHILAIPGSVDRRQLAKRIADGLQKPAFSHIAVGRLRGSRVFLSLWSPTVEQSADVALMVQKAIDDCVTVDKPEAASSEMLVEESENRINTEAESAILEALKSDDGVVSVSTRFVPVSELGTIQKGRNAVCIPKGFDYPLIAKAIVKAADSLPFKLEHNKLQIACEPKTARKITIQILQAMADSTTKPVELP